MTFLELKDYLTKHMRMSHVYQPVMIKRLLLEQGKAKDMVIAFDLIRMDESQLDYYRKRVNEMVGKILRKNGVVMKQGSEYRLNGFEQLSPEQIGVLIQLCESRIEGYQNKRGEAIWQHRDASRTPISGSVRYEVLKRAQGRCELCGISMELRALEVDHIVPKNWHGQDALHNYQALCYKCNANKRDTDATDFRGLPMMYEHREEYCLFCSIEPKRVVAENNLAFVIEDIYPVTPLHHLVIPKRHYPDFFEMKQPELNAVNQLLHALRKSVLTKDTTVTGFNIGINQGHDAGQTINHCHVHLIPRRTGDMKNPRGGVRHCVEGKGHY